MNVLAVDDQINVLNGLMVGVQWKKLGIDQVYKAGNAAEAKRILRACTVDILLSDIEMPGESGLEFISSVREKADLDDENIECIILTCYPDYKFMRKAMQIRCSDYLIKPLDTEEMTEVLKKAIEKIKKKFQKDEKERAFFQDETKATLSDGQQNIIEQKVIPYIREHFSESLTVTEIAADAALNPQYMMRLFKKKTGISVLEFVTNCRMKMAKELLKNTDWNNEIVSDKLGYASSGYFIKLFKKTFGMTPREFRKASGI
mgnify:CR=1 FL=1